MIPCPRCGNENDESARNCSWCDLSLDVGIFSEEGGAPEAVAAVPDKSQAGILSEPPPRRAYVVLTAILLVVGSAVLLRTAVPAAMAGDGAALWSFLGAGMCLVTALGLFKYKNWARRLMIVIGVWGGIDWALLTIAGWWIWSYELPPFVLGLMVLGAPVLIGIAIWFATRRRDFR